MKAFELLFLFPCLRQPGIRPSVDPDVAVDFPAAFGLFLPDLRGLPLILYWGVQAGHCEVGGIGAADDGRVALNIDFKMKKRGFSPLFYPKATSTIVKSSSKVSEFPKFFA